MSNEIKSIRLTNFLKDAIIESVLEAFRIKVLKPENVETYAELDIRIENCKQAVMSYFWLQRYGKYQIFLNQLPDELRARREFKIMNMRGDCMHAQLEGKPGSGYIDMRMDDDKWDEAFQGYNALVKFKAEASAEIARFKAEVHPIVYSCNTTKTLVELWPGVEKFLPANIADPERGIRLPMLAVSRLEEKLNG